MSECHINIASKIYTLMGMATVFPLLGLLLMQ